MIIVQKTVKTNDGYITTFSLSEEQMNFLLTFAINSLVAQGLATIDEQEENENQSQLELLENLDTEGMGQA